MALISFKFHRKTLLFLFGLAVLNGFQEYIYSNIIPKDDKPAENFKEKYNPLLLMVIIYFGDICCGILEIIRRKRNKSSQLIFHESKLNEKGTNKKLKIMGKDVFFILLISLIDLCVITYICYKHGMLLFDISSIMKIGQIIFLGILSQCFLSSKLYRHHIVAQIFIGVGIILLSFFAILNGIYKIKLYDIFSMKNYIQAALIIVHFPLSRNRYHFEFSDFLNL